MGIYKKTNKKKVLFLTRQGLMINNILKEEAIKSKFEKCTISRNSMMISISLVRDFIDRILNQSLSLLQNSKRKTLDVRTVESSIKFLAKDDLLKEMMTFGNVIIADHLQGNGGGPDGKKKKLRVPFKLIQNSIKFKLTQYNYRTSKAACYYISGLIEYLLVKLFLSIINNKQQKENGNLGLIKYRIMPREVYNSILKDKDLSNIFLYDKGNVIAFSGMNKGEMNF